MNNNYELVEQFKIMYEKQELISKIVNNDIYQRYSNNELHTIACIGDNKLIKGSDIALQIGMTRSAISKIVRRLTSDELLETSYKKDNKKEILYRLSPRGNEIYLEHQIAHQQWIDRDVDFLSSKPSEAVERTLLFIKEFNNHLDKIIKENRK